MVAAPHHKHKVIAVEVVLHHLGLVVPLRLPRPVHHRGLEPRGLLLGHLTHAIRAWLVALHDALQTLRAGDLDVDLRRNARVELLLHDLGALPVSLLLRPRSVQAMLLLGLGVLAEVLALRGALRVLQSALDGILVCLPQVIELLDALPMQLLRIHRPHLLDEPIDPRLQEFLGQLLELQLLCASDKFFSHLPKILRFETCQLLLDAIGFAATLLPQALAEPQRLQQDPCIVRLCATAEESEEAPFLHWEQGARQRRWRSLCR
mmetsp:Transcript_10772/g.37731  ORF Transcript_10772/g.37731 Transcript_10772/m.37731 type:complete len:263 (+) Transcript_10772:1190-1978(+)